MIFIRFVLIIVYFLAVCRRGASSDNRLEIKYELSGSDQYQSRVKTAIYGLTGETLTLRCMLPKDTPANVQLVDGKELIWGKDDDQFLCAKSNVAVRCEWIDFSSDQKHRPFKSFIFPLTDQSTGRYFCWHGSKKYAQADVQVRVASSLVTLTINGTLSQLSTVGNVYQLPNKSINEAEKYSLILECKSTSERKTPKRIVWRKNEEEIKSDQKFQLDDSRRRLEIRKADSRDDGVYLCEMQFDEGGSNIKAYHFVVLKGDLSTNTASILNVFHRSLYILVPMIAWIMGSAISSM